MKAIVQTKYGSPDVLQLREVKKPIPSRNEVLVKVLAASASTAEGMMRTGTPYIGRLFTGLLKPKNLIPGTGFAGEIETIGIDVTQFKIGDQIFGESISTFGTNAEYLSIAEDSLLIEKPKNMSYEEAATVCDGTLTSMNFLKSIAHIKKGQRVLINGASGSLGTAAIQLAKHFGAEVTAVSSTTNLELVRSLGADNVIDYTKEDFTAGQNRYDIIYDTVGKSSFSKTKNSLTENGIYLSPVFGISHLLQMLWTSVFTKKKAMFSATGALPVSELKTFLVELNELIKKEKIISVIDRKYSLEQTASAHAYVDKGHKKGNVVITVNQ